MWRTWGVALFDHGRAVGVRGHYRLKFQAKRDARRIRRRLGGRGYADIGNRIDVVRRSSSLSADWGADFEQLADRQQVPSVTAPASAVERKAPVGPASLAGQGGSGGAKKRPGPQAARIEGTRPEPAASTEDETVDLREPQPKTRTQPRRKATVRRHEG